MGLSSSGPPFHPLRGRELTSWRVRRLPGPAGGGCRCTSPSTEQLGEACVHACECQGCRWHQTLEAAGTEANSARARTEARTGGGLYAQLTQDTTARWPQPRGLVSQQPVQSHPRHRVGPGERPPSAQLEPAAQPGPRGPLCRQAFSGPGAAPWDAQ